jgi:NADH:ubiquinone oxidoreductase subunit 6 (subunit J)
MDEPSVLDYVKEKLTFWKKGQLSIPPVDESQEPEQAPPPKGGIQPGIWQKAIIFLPVLFALIGQAFGEPEYRSVGAVIVFYGSASISLILLIYFNKWQVGSLLRGEGEAGPFTVRWVQFMAGFLVSLLAFVLFGGNQFNLINITFWIIGQILIWWSIWEPENWPEKIRSAWQGFIENGFRVTPWAILVGIVFSLSAFYRFYLLNQVPPEMFSDHAEKLIDVSNLLWGDHAIFFPRNTGREAFQMYLTAAMAKIFGTGISFLSLKLGTCLAGLFSLPFMYLLGKEVKNKQVGLLTMFFAGIAYWPNVISRVALRFALYPAFVAPTLFFLIRGLKRKRWNDFLFSGLFLGLGLHGYSPFRIVPIVVFVILLIYFIHEKSRENRRMALFALLLVGLISLLVFLPLGRYALGDYDMFAYRMRTRMTGAETAIPGTFLEIFFSNLWKALIMFQWDNGQIWVHSVPGRPALGLVAGAMFSLGVVLVGIRYLKRRHWLDLSLLLMIPVLILPSVLSIAFPAENPSLNRSGGAIIPVFLIVAFSIESFADNLKERLSGKWGVLVSWAVVLLLAIVSLNTNAKLVFEDYYQQFKNSAWNTSEIGSVIRQFDETIGDNKQAWVIPYPHWVDTRLVGIQAVGFVKDFALWQSDIESTMDAPVPKLYIFKADDEETSQILKDLFPGGVEDRYESSVAGRDFMLYYVLDDGVGN